MIVEAALRLRARSLVLDGEAVILGDGGLADFDRLHTRKHDAEVKLIAFDLLSVGEDVRSLPLHERKGLLAKLLAKSGGPGSQGGIQLNPHFEGAIGPAMFEHACKMGLEGIVSKHRDRAYRAGRTSNWVKVKNPASPAMARVEEGSW